MENNIAEIDVSAILSSLKQESSQYFDICPLSPVSHTGHGLEQGIGNQLAGLLPMRFLCHGPCRHQSSEGSLHVILPLLFGIHEGHASVQEGTNIKPALFPFTAQKCL